MDFGVYVKEFRETRERHSLPLLKVRPRAWNPLPIGTLCLDIDVAYEKGTAGYDAGYVIWDHYGEILIAAVFSYSGGNVCRAC